MLIVKRLNLTEFKFQKFTSNKKFFTGHADNLAKAQKAEVQFVIHTLPIIDYMAEISKTMGNGFNLFSGTSAETSGGLLIAVEKEKVGSSMHLFPNVTKWHSGGTTMYRTGTP